MALRKKLYYVPAEIRENIYTSGKEWMILDTWENYVGYYHTYESTGEVYSEPVWNPSKSKKLTPYKEKPDSYFRYVDLVNYQSTSQGKKELIGRTRYDRYSAPVAVLRDLTEKERKSGVMNRYFVLKRNERETKLPIEISESQAKTYDYSITGINQYLYELVKIPWKVSGPEFDVIRNGILVEPGIFNTNKRIVDRYSKKFPILKRVLTNFREFSIYNTNR